VAYFDGKGKVQFANRSFRDLVPYQEDPIGIAASVFLDGACYQQSYRARQRALLGETAGFTVDIEQHGVIRHHRVAEGSDPSVRQRRCKTAIANVRGNDGWDTHAGNIRPDPFRGATH